MIDSAIYMVATPIGNLGDITVRALDVLRGVAYIYAEDTRVTRKLLDRYEITTPLRSYREAMPRAALQRTLAEMAEVVQAGGAIAFVSDAGTPGVSDPGNYLVEQLRERAVPVVAIPGASALPALLSVAGLGVQRPLFVGFLPKKKGKQTLLRQLKEVLQSDVADGIVLYESPERMERLLADFAAWGLPVRLCIGRELTKKFEEIITGDLATVMAHFQKHAPRGEFVVLCRL